MTSTLIFNQARGTFCPKEETLITMVSHAITRASGSRQFVPRAREGDKTPVAPRNRYF
jgi:hypothetical protein